MRDLGELRKSSDDLMFLLPMLTISTVGLTEISSSLH